MAEIVPPAVHISSERKRLTDKIRGNRLSSVGAQTLTMDANGNIAAYITLDWQEQRRALGFSV